VKNNKNVHINNIHKTLTSVPSPRRGRNGRGGWRTAKNSEKGGGLAAPERASVMIIIQYDLDSDKDYSRKYYL